MHGAPLGPSPRGKRLSEVYTGYAGCNPPRHNIMLRRPRRTVIESLIHINCHLFPSATPHLFVSWHQSTSSLVSRKPGQLLSPCLQAARRIQTRPTSRLYPRGMSSPADGITISAIVPGTSRYHLSRRHHEIAQQSRLALELLAQRRSITLGSRSPRVACRMRNLPAQMAMGSSLPL